jgi:hypothetical protein
VAGLDDGALSEAGEDRRSPLRDPNGGCRRIARALHGKQWKSVTWEMLGELVAAAYEEVHEGYIGLQSLDAWMQEVKSRAARAEVRK